MKIFKYVIIILIIIILIFSGCIDDVIQSPSWHNETYITENYYTTQITYLYNVTAYREPYNMYGGGNNTVYYQNTGESPLHVSVSLHDTLAGRYMLAYTSDSDTIPNILVAKTTSSSTNPTQLNFIVLPGHYYMVGADYGTQVIDSWIEWS